MMELYLETSRGPLAHRFGLVELHILHICKFNYEITRFIAKYNLTTTTTTPSPKGSMITAKSQVTNVHVDSMNIRTILDFLLQITLDTATAMFTSSQGSSSDMDVDSIHSEELQTVPNIETVTTNLELAPE